MDCCNASFKPSKLAPAKAGIDKRKAILLESNRLNFKNLAAVIVIPALLTPGTKASIWNRPINKIIFRFKSNDIFLFVFCWSEKN